ncbi:MAG: helix-turn-helix domain-containing protein [Porticoccaceae bacterium]
MKLDAKTKLLLQDRDKRWAWITYQLHLDNSSIAQVARDAGIRSQTLASVKRNPYPKMEKILADRLGVGVTELFPDRYTEDGLPRRMFPSRSVYCLGRKHITDAAGGNG